MKTIFFLFGMGLLFFNSTGYAQIKNLATATVEVNGNCEMCQKKIQSAAFKKGVSSASWDMESHMAFIQYDSTQTSLDAILRKIADAGYDNERFTAPDKVYARLPHCCQYDRSRKFKTNKEVPKMENKKSDAHMHHGYHHSEPDAPVSHPVKEFFDRYFNLKDALVQSDALSASLAARSFLAAVDHMEMDQLKPGEHQSFMKLMGSFRDWANKIIRSDELSDQRPAFQSLSESVYQFLQQSDYPQPVYLQRCPMYAQGKGANWLSTEKIVNNPYYGNAMLRCGNTLETIL